LRAVYARPMQGRSENRPEVATKKGGAIRS